MSGPTADAPELKRVELGEDAITLELQHSAFGVGVMALKFRKHSKERYRLAEVGYTTSCGPADPPMFLFLAEADDGKRYR